MAAFDRVCSGIPQMDEVFDNIRLGFCKWRLSDNICIYHDMNDERTICARI